MNTIYIKPDLSIHFAMMPFIGVWLQHDYDNANSNEEVLNLMHKWFKEAEKTTNKSRKFCYEASAKRLYTLLTGKSFESKIQDDLL